MAAYRRVYDSRHLQADCQGPDTDNKVHCVGARPYGTVQICLLLLLITTI